MNRTKIVELYRNMEQLDGKTVTVAGWTKSVRDMKNFGFVTLNDGSCFKDLQVVMNREALANYDEISRCSGYTALVCTGTVKLTPEAQQPFELTAETITVEGACAADYPSSSFAPSSTSARVRISSAPCSASAPWPPRPFTASSREETSSTSTPRSSPRATARARARCSASPRLTRRTRRS